MTEYGGNSSTHNMTGMTIEEALQVALQVAVYCASAPCPPKNPNVLIRAMYAIQCYMMHQPSLISSHQYKRCVAGRNIIAAWMLCFEGYEIGTRAQAITHWENVTNGVEA